MSNDKYDDISQMPKSRRVATRIILAVWGFLAVLAIVFVIALFA